MGGVCVPGTNESERIAASLSTSSAGFSKKKKEKREEGQLSKADGPYLSMLKPHLESATKVHINLQHFATNSHQ